MFRYPVIIEKANGNYSAYCPDLPGCIATGKTVEETLTQIKEAIQFHLLFYSDFAFVADYKPID